MQEKRAIGRYADGSVGSLPGLGKGMRMDGFQQTGYCPVSQLVLYINKRLSCSCGVVCEEFIRNVVVS